MNNLKILVSLPVYNEARLLKRAINSILDQTYSNFSLVIVNDASTDDSLKEAEKFLYDPRVRIVNNKNNSGCFYSKNTGIRFMETESYDIYTTHDADDFSQPTRFQQVVDIFNSNSRILGVQDLELRFGNTPPSWYGEPFTPMVNLAHAFFNKKAFEVLGYFDNTDYSGDEDYWNRLNVYCGRNQMFTHTLQEILYYAEITNDNMILRYDDDLRQIYRDKFWKEIEQMSITNNFRREFFQK
jgi:glycosyltransferase involved in cell wall biosynthesis